MVREGLTRQRYSMREHGDSTQMHWDGIRILKESCIGNASVAGAPAKCKTFRPASKGKPTTIRILPGINPENPAELDTCRNPDTEYGDWIRRYDTVKIGTGRQSVQFILKDPRDREVDLRINPAWMLYGAIKAAVNSGQCDPAWNPLIHQGPVPALSAPSDSYLVQALIFELDTVQSPIVGSMVEHPQPIVVMTKTAGQSLIRQLEQRGPDGNFIWPDITAFDAGAFVTLRAGGAVAQQALIGQSAQGQRSSAQQGYEARLAATFNYGGQMISANFAQYAPFFALRVRAWDDIVWIPTVEEQIQLICNAGIPASAIVYALQEHYGQFIPESVFQQLQASTSRVGYTGPVAGMPGGTPGFVPGASAVPGMAGMQPGFAPSVTTVAQSGPAIPGSQPVQAPAVMPGMVMPGMPVAAPAAAPITTPMPAASMPPAGPQFGQPVVTPGQPLPQMGGPVMPPATVPPTGPPMTMPVTAPVTAPPAGPTFGQPVGGPSFGQPAMPQGNGPLPDPAMPAMTGGLPTTGTGITVVQPAANGTAVAAGTPGFVSPADPAVGPSATQAQVQDMLEQARQRSRQAGA